MEEENKKKKRRRHRGRREQQVARQPGQFSYNKSNGTVTCGRCGMHAFVGELAEYRCPKCRLLVWLDHDLRDNKAYSMGAD